ncbi:hypothetical protein BpHYR1_026294 [Brachionus plicatilis]|uniref:Uncharacterized protein n=1 Tax=Brachionus plicatilis TaxID=10195 RepID=A0A3M7Q950_BRAPC|nr:hypothetical protein BpHYR1_026294 [Brachionus plicatilis]
MDLKKAGMNIKILKRPRNFQESFFLCMDLIAGYLRTGPDNVLYNFLKYSNTYHFNFTSTGQTIFSYRYLDLLFSNFATILIRT